ncbi:alpha/beta hydrolase [Micromonospora sp. NPDC050980]|uniref:alpha/beta fold hydrolase n=1 Tax=Micromonospora sp. NPDC050980 TaxID=3155161 RepID=UPI0033C80EF1
MLVVGSSLGGWVAAEMARDTAGLVSGLALVDAVGIDVPGEPIQGFFTLDPPTLGEYTWHDPKLRRRPARVRVPALLLCGESDRIVTPTYGAAYAAAFGDGRLVVVPEAGHLPHTENPAATLSHLDARAWLDRHRDSRA